MTQLHSAASRARRVRPREAQFEALTADGSSKVSLTEAEGLRRER